MHPHRTRAFLSKHFPLTLYRMRFPLSLSRFEEKKEKRRENCLLALSAIEATGEKGRKS